MRITFFSNNADNRKVDKTNELTTIKTLDNVTFKQDANKGEPTIELAYDADIENANYCYIQELNYYYYMSEPTFSTQRMFSTLTTDLLMTYADDILNLGCIISRQENKYNAYLKDDKYPTLAKQMLRCVPFPSGFANTESNILIVNGG